MPSVHGHTLYSMSPANPADKTFAELQKALTDHFEPKPLVIAELFYFHQRAQGTNESVLEYVAELRRLATHCEFGAFLQDALRDRLVCGLRSIAAQKNLLSEENLSLEKAIRVAQSLEAADKNAKKLKADDAASTPIHRIGHYCYAKKPANNAKTCYCCGDTDHIATTCRFRDAECKKCQYLGHRIDSKGLHTLESKVTAVVDAPHPRDVQELRSFLGLVHYYGKFLQNLSTLLHPLNQLLKQGSKWHWSKECDKAFTKAKQCLVMAPVLAHYNPNLPIRLAADASAYGIGAVISHVFPDGTERPVAFASRTLTATEHNYAQIQKEALSLIYAVQKFHQYLYGRSFVLVTDHKPLTTILGHKAGIPSLAAARLQRWALILSAYSYTIEFRPTKQHANADGLSRLPLGTCRDAALDCINTFMIGQIQAMPVTAKQVQATTRRDPVLSSVMFKMDGLQL